VVRAYGVQILFALPSMVIATIFVSLPFVAREVDADTARDRR
jgi:ABC-type sulfate transport system permease subunit